MNMATIIDEIREAQALNGVTQLQSLIESGEVWKFEGAMGRAAMAALESGECFLPDHATFDYYGNRLPARSELKPGTKGTLENAYDYWLFNGTE